MELTKKIHTFDVSMNWNNELNEGIAHSGKRKPLIFGSAPEFGGTENEWSPEHLLCASLASCYTITFHHFAKLLKVQISSFHISSEVDFEKTKTGFVATRFIIRPAVKFSQDLAQSTIDDLFVKAKKYCFISNSVKGEVVVEANVTSA